MKNAGDQRILNKIWSQKNQYPFRLFCTVIFVANKINERIIVIYKNTHAGENTPDGGVKGGLINVEYQLFIPP